jgi:hypothetical protein
MEKIKKIKKFLKKTLIDISWEKDGLKVKIILIFFLY